MSKKQSIETMLQELVTDRIETELHRQLRKARKAVVRQRHKTRLHAIELQALPMPDSDVIDGEVVGEESYEGEQTERGE